MKLLSRRENHERSEHGDARLRDAARCYRYITPRRVDAVFFDLRMLTLS
jgi:hypothetical protein